MSKKLVAAHISLVSTLVVACASSAGAPGSERGLSISAGELLYVANQGSATVSVIDTETLMVVESIDLRDLGFSENAKPHHVAAERDGSHWYLSLIGENRILRFDADNRLVGQSGFEVPGMLALNPVEDLIYVGRSMSAVNPPQRIGLIPLSDMVGDEPIEADEVDVFFPRPHALAVHPTGSHTYTASLGVNQLASVDNVTQELNLIDLRRDGDTPLVLVQFAIAPDGATMVGTAQLAGEVLLFDLSDPASPKLGATLSVEAHPWHPVFSPDGRRVFFGNKEANAVTVLDVLSRSVVKVIRGEGFAQPHGSAVTSDGRLLFISNNNSRGDYRSQSGEAVGTVVVIDTGTLEIVKVIEVGGNPAGLGILSAR